MVEIQSVSKGAELISVKFDGIEKIHDGKSFWNRHSPILFPIVGKLKKRYELEFVKQFYEKVRVKVKKIMDI